MLNIAKATGSRLRSYFARVIIFRKSRFACKSMCKNLNRNTLFENLPFSTLLACSPDESLHNSFLFRYHGQIYCPKNPIWPLLMTLIAHHILESLHKNCDSLVIRRTCMQSFKVLYSMVFSKSVPKVVSRYYCNLKFLPIE